ncbi:ATP-binding cassette domain-containing protein [Methylobacterium iners]|uniref:Nickel import ATP-binding protein NikO n=1 Tax=Methylobacterium iners TaxID=418707 RepID=A0ABQ4RY55_9HYPH|nr:ATP-binding cassette domain-containing protein [Methylobacterium iners]GJD95128.1 Nickel import ATP-binding protein NikO [Methylobacterium iners]
MSGVPILIAGLRFATGGITILDGVDATLPGTGITALVGPNGAGKSVLLRLVDDLLAPSAGTIRIGLPGAPPVRRAFVFQRPGFVRASAARNVALALAPLHLRRRERDARTAAALARAGLEGRGGEPATRLSGGEQQRLALSRAWATQPDLLLLDEPTANLDPTATERVERMIAAIAEAGTKVVLVSHNLGQVARLADDILVLSAGRAVEHGPTRQVISRPSTPEARAYLTGELPWTSFAAAC